LCVVQRDWFCGHECFFYNGTMTYNSLISYVIILWCSFNLSFVKSSARLMVFLTLYWLLRHKYNLSLFIICLVILYDGAFSGNLNQSYGENIRYIRNNDPQSASAQQTLINLHEYGSIIDTMSLFKPIHKMSMLTPTNNCLFKHFNHNGNLVTEQGTGEQNRFISVCRWHRAYVSNHIKIRADQYTIHSTLRPLQTLPQPRHVAVTVMYIIHYSTEHIAFSTEILYLQQL
jgi:hypothetical protein